MDKINKKRPEKLTKCTKKHFMNKNGQNNGQNN